MGNIILTRQNRFSILGLLVVSKLAYAGLIGPFAFAAESGQTLTQRITVTEQDIYDNPDDNALNLQYAKEQIKLGEMLNAGAALERMLYTNPNWHSARLLYAAVLYRLDDQQAALRELSLLEGKDLNQDQSETLVRYRETFQTPQILSAYRAANIAGSLNSAPSHTPKRVQSQLTAGLAIDDNAGNAFTDVAFGFENSRDVSTYFGANVDIFLPLTDDNKTVLTAGAGVIVQRHDTFEQANFDVYDVHAGLRIKAGESRQFGEGRVTLEGVGRQFNINGEKYLQQLGPRVIVTEPISMDTHVSLTASVFAQDYSNLKLATQEDERDGIKMAFQIGMSKKLNAKQKFLAAIAYEKKSADREAFAYDGPVIAAQFKHTLDSKNYLTAQIKARQLNFDGSLLSGAGTRKDTRLTARTAFGVPIGRTGHLSAENKTRLEIGANYNNRNSNIAASDYENFGLDARLVIGF